MEDRAPYHTAASKGPRNLAAELAAWLRTQGFTATENRQPTSTTLLAYWLSARGERFELTYTWVSGPAPSATCALTVRPAGRPRAEVLFTAQHVRRLKEARLLVNNCVRLANARLLTTLPHPAL